MGRIVMPQLTKMINNHKATNTCALDVVEVEATFKILRRFESDQQEAHNWDKKSLRTLWRQSHNYKNNADTLKIAD